MLQARQRERGGERERGEGEWEREREGRGSHWRTRVSVQEVIERDRRAPECHTWAMGGQRRTGVGRTQPFTAQAFTTERNHLPGPAHTLPPLCSVKTVHVQLRACINPSVCVCACACSVCAHVFLRGGRNSWFQKEVSHCQQEHRLACLPVKNKAVCSLLELRSGFGLSEEACAFCTDTTHALRGHLQRHRSQQHFSETYQSFVWLNSWLKRVHCGCRKSCFITPEKDRQQGSFCGSQLNQRYSQYKKIITCNTSTTPLETPNNKKNGSTH